MASAVNEISSADQYCIACVASLSSMHVCPCCYDVEIAACNAECAILVDNLQWERCERCRKIRCTACYDSCHVCENDEDP